MYIDNETRKEVNIYAPYKGFSKLDSPEIRAIANVIWIDDPRPPEDIRSDVEINPDYYIESPTGDNLPPYKVWSRRNEEQIAEIRLIKAKQKRQEELDQTVVITISGKTFDGDEISQNRMARAITGMEPLETILWVLADNIPAYVTREELKEALRLAGAAQTAIWATPYIA